MQALSQMSYGPGAVYVFGGRNLGRRAPPVKFDFDSHEFPRFLLFRPPASRAVYAPASAAAVRSTSRGTSPAATAQSANRSAL
jgi:hypothetical protein